MAANLAERPRQYSNSSTAFFFHLVEHVGRALEPTATQLQSLERSYGSTSEFLVSCPEFEGELLEVHPQGSRELGTLVRPLRGGDGFDVDLVARFDRKAHGRYSSTASGVLLVDRLYVAVKRYADRHGLALKRWERCVTLEYADGMCADIAPVIDYPSHVATYGDTHGLIPDRELKSLEPTNPKGFTRLFNDIAAIQPKFTRTVVAKAMAEDIHRADVKPLSDAEDVFGRLLCRLIQLIKLHRDASFAKAPALKDEMPTSIFLTALATAAYKQEAPLPHQDPLDLFLDVTKAMPRYIQRSHLSGREDWVVDNPTAPGDNLASAMNSGNRQKVFEQWHARFMGDISAIIDAIEERQGIDHVGRLVGVAFGERAANAMMSAQLTTQGSQRKSGQALAVSAGGIVLPITARAHTFFGT